MEFVKFKLMVCKIELRNVRVEGCLGVTTYLRLKITDDTIIPSKHCWNICIFLDQSKLLYFAANCYVELELLVVEQFQRDLRSLKTVCPGPAEEQGHQNVRPHLSRQFLNPSDTKNWLISAQNFVTKLQSAHAVKRVVEILIWRQSVGRRMVAGPGLCF